MTDAALQQALERALERSPRQPAWLQAARSEALARFDDAGGFPTTRREDWKYTDLRGYAERLTAYVTRGDDSPPPESPAADEPDLGEAIRIGFRNGRLGPLPAAGDGLRLQRLADLTGDGDAAAAAELLASQPHPGIADLGTAFATDGLLIEVAADAAIAAPIHLRIEADGQAVSAQPLLILRMAPRSEARLVLDYRSGGEASGHTVLLADCADGAKLEIVRVQEESDEAHHLAAQAFRLGRDSRLNLSLVDLGGALVRHDLRVELAGPGADARLHGLFVASGDAHIDYHTRLDHAAPHTRSSEIVRGIAADRGRGIFSGKVVVHEGADGTDADMSNRNLLLSPRAEIDTKPELEIYADDVKCAHGATTGQLDANALFYLRSRGVDAATARRILVTAFAGEVIEAVQPESLREHLLARLAERLGRPLPEGTS